jgi:hypothetical protein
MSATRLSPSRRREYICKRQPMCWTTEGSHLLLQVRCAALDGKLDALFREWYPRFRLKSMALQVPAL